MSPQIVRSRGRIASQQTKRAFAAQMLSLQLVAHTGFEPFMMPARSLVRSATCAHHLFEMCPECDQPLHDKRGFAALHARFRFDATHERYVLGTSIALSSAHPLITTSIV